MNIITHPPKGILFLVAITTLMAGGSALGCSCHAPPIYLETLRAEHVFVGRVTRLEPTESRFSHIAHVDVSTVFKGDVGNQVTVINDGDDLSSCGHGAFLQEGNDYLIYAEGNYSDGRADLIPTSCGRTEHLAGAAADIAALSALQPVPLEPQIYFTDQRSNRIHRVGLDGASPVVHVDPFTTERWGPWGEVEAPVGIAISGSKLTLLNNMGICTLGLDGSALDLPWGDWSDLSAEFSFSSAGPAFLGSNIVIAIAIAGNGNGGGRIVAMPQPDWSVFETSSPVVSLAATESDLFWTEDGQDAIRTASLHGQDATELLDLDATFGEAEYDVAGLATAGSVLLWTDRAQDAVFTYDLQSGSASRLVDCHTAFGAADYSPAGVAVHGTTVYWAEGGDGVSGIYAVELDGSNPRLILDSPTDKPQWLAISPAGDQIAADLLRVESFDRPGPESARLTWRSVPGVRYRVEKSPDLRNWAELAVLEGGLGMRTGFTDHQTDGGQAFYRVVLVPGGE